MWTVRRHKKRWPLYRWSLVEVRLYILHGRQCLIAFVNFKQRFSRKEAQRSISENKIGFGNFDETLSRVFDVSP